jgi:hypothetical protein
MPQLQKSGRRKHSTANIVLAMGMLIAFTASPKLREAKNTSAIPLHSPFQNRVHVDDGRKLPVEKSSVIGSAPFRVGEILNYRLTWSVFTNAAAVQLEVVERRDLFGTPTWHFRASARTQTLLRSLAEIDDQFDSYAEIETLESKQYETYLNELGEKQNTVSQLVLTTHPTKNRASVVLVKPHTRDPLAALYVLRAIDWQHNSEFRAPVYDGEELYEMRARMELPADVITVAGREVKATKISVQLFRGSYLSRTRCSIWFSQDAERIPMVIDAQVPYGGVRAELVSQR